MSARVFRRPAPCEWCGVPTTRRVLEYDRDEQGYRWVPECDEADGGSCWPRQPVPARTAGDD